MIAHATPQERLPELISRLGAILHEIDDATGGQVDALVDPAGQVSYLLRGAQEALIRQEQEFRALVENASDMILRLDRGLRLAYCNPATLRLLGATLDEVRGRTIAELARRQPGAAEWEAAAGAVVATGRAREGEFTVGAGPRAAVYHSRFNPEFGPDGRVASVLVVSRDTTAIHASTRELAAAHARISGILESVTDAFFAVDAGWRFTYLNPRAELLLRRSRAALLGQVLWDAFPEALGSTFEREYRRVAAERSPRVFEEYFAPLGAWFEVHAYPADDGGLSIYFRDVTQRRERERQSTALVDAVAAERALLEAVLRQLPVGVVIADASTGALVMGNQEVDNIFGHGFRASHSVEEYGEWVGYHADGRRVQAHEWPLARALREGRAVGPEEYTMVRADGTPGTARLSASPVLDRNGTPIAAVVVMVDVTEPRAVMDALRATEERYRLVNLATNDIIWDWDIKAGRLSWNDAVASLGYRRSEVTETLAWWSAAVHPDDVVRVEASLERFLADGEELYWSEDYRFRRGDGTWARVFDRAHMVRDAQGRPVRMIGSMLDMSQRDAAEAALHQQEMLLDSVEQAVIATDVRGVITFWNRFAEELYGWSRDEVVGRPALEVTPSDEMAEQGAAILERLLRGESWSGQFRVRRKDGSCFLAQVTDTPIHSPSGELVGRVGVSFDITERRELEEQLRQSQKMEAVGQLAGGVAHDFNNLLTVIQGTVELLRADLPAGDPVRADIDEIGQAAERAAGLTRQLLAFSRRQILNPQRVNLGGLIGGMLPMLTRLIGEHIELRFQAGASEMRVEADPGQLEQVLLNLVVNARDAVPAAGGRILVQTGSVQVSGGDEDPHAGLAPGRYALMAVTDTGTGMPDEVRRRVFEPFYTTKEPGKGTGLGLSTAYGIVKQTGGEIFVDSAPGAGTTFRVYLPACDAPAAVRGHASPAPLEGTETVLLIEDEPAVRSLTRRVLTRHGYTVLEARNGAEALSIVRQRRHRIDLVISDVVMPEMSGPAAAREIVEAIGPVPVLYISGYTDDEILRQGIQAAEAHFLQKPFSPAAVLAQVRSMLDGARA